MAEMTALIVATRALRVEHPAMGAKQLTLYLRAEQWDVDTKRVREALRQLDVSPETATALTRRWEGLGREAPSPLRRGCGDLAEHTSTCSTSAWPTHSQSSSLGAPSSSSAPGSAATPVGCATTAASRRLSVSMARLVWQRRLAGSCARPI